jgi:tetratricopeptide (TPR) repeat protein
MRPTLEDIENGYAWWMERNEEAPMAGLHGPAIPFVDAFLGQLEGVESIALFDLSGNEYLRVAQTHCSLPVTIIRGSTAGSKAESLGYQSVRLPLFSTAPIKTLFDVVLLGGILNATPDILLRDVISSWKRIVKPGGMLLLSALTGHENASGWTEYSLSGSLDPVVPIYVSIRTDERLEMSVETNGLTIERKHQVSVLPETHSIWRSAATVTVLACRKPTRVADPIDWKSCVARALRADSDHESIEVLEQAVEESMSRGLESDSDRANRLVALDSIASLAYADPIYYRTVLERLYVGLFIPPATSNDFSLFWVLGSLFHKAGEYDHAVDCLDRAIEISPKDYRPYLRRGYCLEGLLRLREATQSGIKAEQLYDAEDTVNNVSERAEIWHALGHFFAGASYLGRTEPDESSFTLGLSYMIKACQSGENGLDYVSCVGSMFSEREQYQLALFWFDWARTRLPEKPDDSRLQEVQFYKAVALLGAGHPEETRAVLSGVREWALRSSDWDALCHVALYDAKSYVTGDSVVFPGAARLDDLSAQVRNHPPSRYVVSSVRRDRQAFILYLEGLSSLDKSSNDVDTNVIESLTTAAAKFRRVTQFSRVSPASVTIVTEGDSYLKGEAVDEISRWGCGIKEVPTSDWLRQVGEPLPESTIVVVEDLHRGILDAALVAAGTVAAVGGTFVVLSPRPSGLARLRKLMPDTVLTDPRLAGLLAATSTYMVACMKHFSYFETPLGLAPIGGAPSRLALQAGAVELVERGNPNA